MAAYAVRAGMKAVVFVPHGRISAAKLAQALEFGAIVVEIGDNFDQAFHLLRELPKDLGLYLVNSLNPFRLEGQKTIVMEILEQREWSVPDYIVVPGGNLGNVSAIGKGIAELQKAGLIQKLPKLVVVQAEGANPFFQMMSSGASEIHPVAEPHTEATAIRIGDPVNWKKALRSIRLTDGLCESVSDVQIFEAKAALSRDGVGCEPASAATLAGLRKLVQAGKIKPGADVVAVLTGNQLKDPEISLKRRGEADVNRQRIQVDADAGKLRAAMEGILQLAVQ
jgi:threonine synthase